MDTYISTHKQLQTCRYEQQRLPKKQNRGKKIPAILPK